MAARPAHQSRSAIGDHAVAAVGADEAGAFGAALEAPIVAPGRYDLTAECGVLLTQPLDVVVSTSVRQGGTALALFAFFVLLSGLLLRRRHV